MSDDNGKLQFEPMRVEVDIPFSVANLWALIRGELCLKFTVSMQRDFPDHAEDDADYYEMTIKYDET